MILWRHVELTKVKVVLLQNGTSSEKSALLKCQETISIEQYHKPLCRRWDVLLFGWSLAIACSAFWRQGQQADVLDQDMGGIFTTLNAYFKITSPVSLIAFSTSNSYELSEFLVKDPGLFWATLCKSKKRIAACFLAAVTSGYVASESTPYWYWIAASVVSSLTTNGSFFIFREPFSNHKDELIGAVNWVYKASVNSVTEALIEAISREDIKTVRREDYQTIRFKEILALVLKQRDSYLKQNPRTNCGVSFFAWAAFSLPTLVYLASGASAWSWILNGMPHDRSGSKINAENLKAHWLYFLVGVVASGAPSYWINGKVNYLSTHRLAEEVGASKLDSLKLKGFLFLVSAVLTVSYIAFNFGLNLNNSLFDKKEVAWTQASFSVFIAPLTFFSLYALPRKIWKKIVSREAQDTNKDNRPFFIETVKNLPPAKLARMIKDIEKVERAAKLGRSVSGSSEGSEIGIASCCSCLFSRPSEDLSGEYKDLEAGSPPEKRRSRGNSVEFIRTPPAYCYGAVDDDGNFSNNTFTNGTS